MRKKECEGCQQLSCCPCPTCKEKGSPKCRELKYKIGLKAWIFWFIFAFSIIGFLGPFIAQCILPFFVSDAEIKGLEMWNQYVGIVLGIVATILSIVSLVMGFYSASEASEQQRKAFEQYQSTIELIRKVEHDVADVNASVGQINKVGTIGPSKMEVDNSQLE